MHEAPWLLTELGHIWNHATCSLLTAWIYDIPWAWAAEEPKWAVWHIHHRSRILRFHTTNKMQNGCGTKLSIYLSRTDVLDTCPAEIFFNVSTLLRVIMTLPLYSGEIFLNGNSDNKQTESFNVNTLLEQLHPFVFFFYIQIWFKDFSLLKREEKINQ